MLIRLKIIVLAFLLSGLVQSANIKPTETISTTKLLKNAVFNFDTSSKQATKLVHAQNVTPALKIVKINSPTAEMLTKADKINPSRLQLVKSEAFMDKQFNSESSHHDQITTKDIPIQFSQLLESVMQKIYDKMASHTTIPSENLTKANSLKAAKLVKDMGESNAVKIQRINYQTQISTENFNKAINIKATKLLKGHGGTTIENIPTVNNQTHTLAEGLTKATSVKAANLVKAIQGATTTETAKMSLFPVAPTKELTKSTSINSAIFVKDAEGTTSSKLDNINPHHVTRAKILGKTINVEDAKLVKVVGGTATAQVQRINSHAVTSDEYLTKSTIVEADNFLQVINTDDKIQSINSQINTPDEHLTKEVNANVTELSPEIVANDFHTTKSIGFNQPGKLTTAFKNYFTISETKKPKTEWNIISNLRSTERIAIKSTESDKDWQDISDLSVTEISEYDLFIVRDEPILPKLVKPYWGLKLTLVSLLVKITLATGLVIMLGFAFWYQRNRSKTNNKYSLIKETNLHM